MTERNSTLQPEACPNCDAPGTPRQEMPGLIASGIDFECGARWDNGPSDFKAQPTYGCIDRLAQEKAYAEHLREQQEEYHNMVMEGIAAGNVMEPTHDD